MSKKGEMSKMSKVNIDSNIMLDICTGYNSLPRKAKKAEKKRIEREIKEVINRIKFYER